ncbi:16S rRNA (cytosine(1402)-N(4))-methyltransferase RsmH [Actinomyces minihominis]|uniref:16S rRNA (cytosine(1402)-N(4))-methyltransferase RsmH n=1 Tax=Actinomyces minihominis TaxID=2002838 RepID=UPI000C07F340|nr:16S rRNA (cytosine(1402)-N(4))-methyltransferase RsmH [Actinomyces minihominis]
MAMEVPLHKPVMLDRCLDLLAPAFEVSNPLMVDATVGLGGHTEGALKRFPQLTVIGIDRDPSALAYASERLAPFGDRFIPFQGTYDQIPLALDDRLANGILMDLGVSSMQLDEVERGFSYAHDAPLDMRMDPTSGESAAELLARVERGELVRILRRYGDEKFAPRIADLVIRTRSVTPLTTTGQLVEIIRSAIPAAARRTGGNPAKRTFQAIRIAVNDELGILEAAVPAALASLTVGGRLVVESYQSLEDRIIKEIFREGSDPHVPAGLPMTASDLDKLRSLRLLTKGAERAPAEEAAQNPRSIPVRLRAAELLTPWRNHVS